jgi:hypothetical protein
MIKNLPAESTAEENGAEAVLCLLKAFMGGTLARSSEALRELTNAKTKLELYRDLANYAHDMASMAGILDIEAETVLGGEIKRLEEPKRGTGAAEAGAGGAEAEAMTFTYDRAPPGSLPEEELLGDGRDGLGNSWAYRRGIIWHDDGYPKSSNPYVTGTRAH